LTRHSETKHTGHAGFEADLATKDNDMESTIHENEHGEWVVTVSRWVIARKESEREAQELQEILLRPGMF